MSKYQEALEKIKEELEFGSRFDYDVYFKKEVKLLQELVERVTPKKPIVKNEFYDELYGDIKYCPNCNSMFEYMDEYCSECGQNIDWSEDE